MSARKQRSDRSRLGRYAEYYARKGLFILPLHSPDGDGGCTCNRPSCPSPGKHPRTSNGVHDATTDLDQIREWWSKWPDANIGMATGHGNPVIEVDFRSGGAVTWADPCVGESHNGGIRKRLLYYVSDLGWRWMLHHDRNGRRRTEDLLQDSLVVAFRALAGRRKAERRANALDDRRFSGPGRHDQDI